MKRSTTIVLLATLTLSLVACGSSKQNPNSGSSSSQHSGSSNSQVSHKDDSSSSAQDGASEQDPDVPYDFTSEAQQLLLGSDGVLNLMVPENKGLAPIAEDVQLSAESDLAKDEHNTVYLSNGDLYLFPGYVGDYYPPKVIKKNVGDVTQIVTASEQLAYVVDGDLYLALLDLNSPANYIEQIDPNYTTEYGYHTNGEGEITTLVIEGNVTDVILDYRYVAYIDQGNLYVNKQLVGKGFSEVSRFAGSLDNEYRFLAKSDNGALSLVEFEIDSNNNYKVTAELTDLGVTSESAVKSGLTTSQGKNIYIALDTTFGDGNDFASYEELSGGLAKVTILDSSIHPLQAHASSGPHSTEFIVSRGDGLEFFDFHRGEFTKINEQKLSISDLERGNEHN
ncbi:MAG: hypothetical protein E7L00_11700 [Propionibacteriaceae bacterium]|nr:hypothetical protein [Propionibacteriaceae bacterium]